ncbi:MAG: hypothetical protein M1546_10470, partial [Chloroflexi bacterium]|nr:hypothetical protein [Chloroflexota bacterium]
GLVCVKPNRNSQVFRCCDHHRQSGADFIAPFGSIWVLGQELDYGCIIGGYKGFVSARVYAVFYAAYHPAESMPERWAVGQVTIDSVPYEFQRGGNRMMRIL